MEMAIELMKAKFEGQAQMSMQNICSLLSHQNEEIRSDVLFQLSESMYCNLQNSEEAPVLLATIWRNFVWEMLERGEWEEDKRAKFMENMDKANAIINEMNVRLPEKMANWRYWDEEDMDEEEESN